MKQIGSIETKYEEKVQMENVYDISGPDWAFTKTLEFFECE